MIVGCVDPGIHSGIAVLDDANPIHLDVMLTDLIELAIDVIDVMRKHKVDVLVVENFVTGYRGGLDSNGLHTIRFIGALQVLGKLHKVVVVMQNPSDRKPFQDEARRLCWSKGDRVQHVSDAVAHIMAYHAKRGNRIDVPRP